MKKILSMVFALTISLTLVSSVGFAAKKDKDKNVVEQKITVKDSKKNRKAFNYAYCSMLQRTYGRRSNFNADLADSRFIRTNHSSCKERLLQACLS